MNEILEVSTPYASYYTFSFIKQCLTNTWDLMNIRLDLFSLKSMILKRWFFQTLKGRVFPVWLICQDNPPTCHLTSWSSRFWLGEWKIPKEWWIYVVWLRLPQCPLRLLSHLGTYREAFCVYSTKNVLEMKVKDECLCTTVIKHIAFNHQKPRTGPGPLPST